MSKRKKLARIFKIQRYDFQRYIEDGLQEDASGDWIKFDDAKPLLLELRLLRRKLKKGVQK